MSNYIGICIDVLIVNNVSVINFYIYSYVFSYIGVRMGIYFEYFEFFFNSLINMMRWRDVNLFFYLVWVMEWGWDVLLGIEVCIFLECVMEIV